MKKFAGLTLSLFLTTGVAFADSPKDTPKEAEAKTTAAAKAAVKTNAQIAKELEELRQTLQTQQEQLQMLKDALAKRDREVEDARKAAADANARAAEASSKAAEAANGTSEVRTSETSLNASVNDLKASNDAIKTSLAKQEEATKKAAEKGPTTIRYKGVNITPGGFVEAATINRQRAESADINSNFNAIPYPNNAVGKLSEMNLTGRHSRLTLLVDTKVGATKLTGYYEADFLGVGTTSNNRQSNSYVFRQRQVWARAEFEGGWGFSAGQMWSLATEHRKGIANRSEWGPLVIDPQYNVGYTWQRAYGARLTKTFGDKFAIGVSAEGPQATLTAHGNSTYTSTSGAVTSNAFVFAPGNGGGLFNGFDSTGYSVNKTPDFVFKAVLDPGWGHYEVFGIVSTFQNRVYPCAVVSVTAGSSSATSIVVLSGPAINPPNCVNSSGAPLTTPSALGAKTDSRTGGGGGASLDVPLFNKKLDVGLKGVYGIGTGRFGSAQLADATLRPDGTLALIHNAHWLGRLEWHATPKLDIYGYVGGEYNARAAYAGYQSVAGTITSPTVVGTGTTAAPEFPQIITWKTSITGIGGYGYPGANNSGCGGPEVAPGGTGAPSGGSGCNGDTRYIGEGTLGFWHKLYQGDKGRVQWGLQYSYFYKNGWSGNNNGSTSVSPHAVDNMVWTSFRYFLP